MKRLSSWIIGMSVMFLVIVSYWMQPPILHRLELLSQNFHFKWRGPITPGNEVVIIAIDEKSLDELGRWPWPRDTIKTLVEKLVDHQVKVIGFDMVFSSPEESPELKKLILLKEELKSRKMLNQEIGQMLDRLIEESDHDADLASALRQSRRAVLGYFFHFTSKGVEHLSSADLRSHFENIKSSQFQGFIKSNENIDLSTLPFRSAYAVESNISVIAKKVRRAGYFTFDAEQDGSIRKLPLIVKYHDTESGEDYYFPPLSIRMLEKYLRGTLLFKVNEYGIEKVLLQGTETLEIPTNERGELYINYLGPSDSFPIVSATDIVNQNYENVPLGSLKDKIVILGPTATALEDIRLTPFDPVFPGVEIHATVIDNILQKNHIFQPDWVPAADSGYMLVMGILLIFIYSRIKPIYGGFIWLAIVIIQLFVNHWIFTEHKFWVSNVFPQIENFFLFISLMIHRYITEEKQKHFIQNVFGQFLSPKVVDQLIEDPSKLKLGGEQKELTAFFSDVAGFSSISENLSPTELVELLNEYLSAMSDILVDHDGTIDKYEGDAIIAFFGAPVNYPDHAKRACLVSLEMQKKLREMRQNWKSQNRPQLNVRIGLNTGLMVIGNMGSTRRMDYTMMGDSVNLASRLEGVNKQYGTFTMLSEFTYIQAKEVIEARELDMIRVVGKSEPIKIYELLGKIGELDGTTQQLVSHFNEGRENYRKRQWDTAITCFQKALAIKSDDGPSSTFMKRCTLFKQSPPPDEWDGVFAMTEK